MIKKRKGSKNQNVLNSTLSEDSLLEALNNRGSNFYNL